MWFWWFMLVCDLLIPILMIIAGNMMWKHSPEKNWVIGYRTTRSMKNTDTWKYAQDYCGRIWWKIGWIMLFPSLVVHFPLYHGSEDTIGAVGGIKKSRLKKLKDELKNFDKQHPKIKL